MTTLQIVQDTVNTTASVVDSITYTPFVLMTFGLGGIALHNLIQLNKINKANGGDVRIGKYLQYERFSILISVIMVGLAVFLSQEIKQLEQVGKWLGLAFVAIGYMGQSLLIAFIGKAEKAVGKTE